MPDVPASPSEGQQDGQQPVVPDAVPQQEMPAGASAAEQIPAEQKPMGEQKMDEAAPGTAPESAQPTGGQGFQMPSILQKAANQPAVTSEEKLWALVSYVPLVGLIALVIKPDNAYIRLHGRQGILLFVIFFFSIFVYLLPFVGALIGALIHIAVILLGIFSMYQAFIGNWWKIPVVGDIAQQIPVEAFTKVTREAVIGPGSGEAETPVVSPLDQTVAPPDQNVQPESPSETQAPPDAEKTTEQPSQNSGVAPGGPSQT